MIFDLKTFFAILLTLGVIFVNGWTDAPNAITGCVCSGAISMRRAVLYAAVANLLGIFISCIAFPFVAKNIFESTNITDSRVLCASLLSVIVLAVSAWFFGIPTSESHAIIASLFGASVATGAKLSIRLASITLLGLVVSILCGFILGYVLYALIKNKNIGKRVLERMQVLSALIMAFWHGAQDGQKFISIFLLAIGASFTQKLPLYPIVICALVMAAGTATGGGRIIENVGKKMVDIDSKRAFASDIAGGISLFLSTVLGMPVSTTHTKTSAVMGCGYVGGGINKKTARQMIAAWLITFPVCFVLGFVFTKLFC